MLDLVLKEESIRFPSVHRLAAKLNWTDKETEERLEKLKKQKKALSLNDGNFFHKEFWERVTGKTTEMLTAFHQANPIAAGMEKEEFKSRILESFYLKEAKKGDVLLNELLKRGIISASGSTVAAAGFSAQYSDEHSDMRQTMIKTYAAAGFEAPSTDEVMAQFKDKKQAKQVLSDLFKDGTLVKLNPGAYLYKDHYEKAMELLRGHFASHDTMSLAEFRDMLGTSRKYVLLILDHLDQQKITKLQGDVRVLLK